MNERRAKALRTAAIIFMGLTAAMNLLGGIGTVCAAFYTKKYPPMWKLLDYQWLYQTLMIVTIAIGILCAWSTMTLVHGKKHAYRNAVILLLIGSIVAGIQVYASLALRGKAVPANIKLYANVATLVLFLLLRLPAIRDWIDFAKPGDGTDRATTGGLAAFMIGCVVLSTESWVGSSHIFQGDNWVHVLQGTLTVGGTILILGGLAQLLRVALDGLPVPGRQVQATSESSVTPPE